MKINHSARVQCNKGTCQPATGTLLLLTGLCLMILRWQWRSWHRGMSCYQVVATKTILVSHMNSLQVLVLTFSCDDMNNTVSAISTAVLVEKHVATVKLSFPLPGWADFLCFRSVTESHSEVLTAQGLTAISWLVSPPLVHLYARDSSQLMGIKPSAHLCVRTLL